VTEANARKPTDLIVVCARPALEWLSEGPDGHRAVQTQALRSSIFATAPHQSDEQDHDRNRVPGCQDNDHRAAPLEARSNKNLPPQQVMGDR